jgi:hypothetical protein
MPSRRSFLRALGVTLAGTALHPERVLADPYRPWTPSRTGASVRVTGRVTAAGRGLAGVRVSDGFGVARTGPDGRYELLSQAHRPFVQLSVPAGHAIPTHATGTGACYRPLRPDAAGEATADFDLERLAVDDTRHVALIMPDVQTQNEFEMGRYHGETVPDVQATVRALGEREVFGVSAGDIMFDDLDLFPRYEEAVAQMGVPFFQVVGNHDLDFDGETDEATTATFSRHFGPRYYSFDRGDVRYVVLDDVLYHGSGYIGYLDHDQLRWLENDLADLEAGSTVIVVTHIPVVGTRHEREGERRPSEAGSINNREVLYRLLEPYAAHVVAGHTHENDHRFGDGVHEHVSGTVCGAWWSGDICGDGTPNGYSVYEVEGSEVRWRYKSTGHPDDHQLRVYARGADPAAPGEIVANVWDADPEWRIVWYEGGDRRGGMRARPGADPRSVIEHTGPDLPERRSWVDPYPTRHLYRAAVPERQGPITVEATDRFGRVYTARLD